MISPSISLATILVAFSAVYVNAVPPKIEPSYSTLYILEGRGVNMTCTSDSDSVKWERNGQPVTNFGFKRSKKVDMEPGSDTSQVSLTISKAVTTAGESGVYTCSANNEERNIDLKVVTVTPTHAEYNRSLSTVTLVCAVSNVDSNLYKLNWVFKDEVIESNDKFTIHKENNSLVINDPAHMDSGEYLCTINITASKQSLTVPVNFYASPYVKKFDKSKNMIQGDPLTLHCDVYSHPPADIKWFKDDKPIDQYEGLIAMDDDKTGLKNGMLRIKTVQFEDKGVYMCLAENKYFNLSANRTILVRVKDKLAALWPFLGIVAEVVVLCVIIFIYEKKRSRSEDEDETADVANCANAADHRVKDEVRQRNVRA